VKRRTARPRLLLPLALAAALLMAPAALAESFTFDRCNRAFQQEAGDLPPMTQGPLTLRMSSPDAVLTVEDHRLDLTPLADGTHRAHFEALFVGSGTLHVDVDVNGAVSRLTDDVKVPPQRRSVDGIVRIAKGVDETGAPVYELTPVEMPKTVPVTIDSNLAGRLGTMCSGFALLLPIDCGVVRGALSVVNVPMPEPGETYLLPPECVDAEVAAKMDRYLGLAGDG